MQKVIQMKNITLSFSGVTILKNVDVHVRSGVAHAIVGANGAGKSSLMKVLSGYYNDYRGQIFIENSEVNIRSSEQGIKKGIQFVQQEVDVALFPNLSVAENIVLHDGAQWINWKEVYAQAKQQCDGLNLDIDVTRNVSELSLAQKQLVLIARALWRGCEWLILDEPTAALSTAESTILFEVIAELKKKNVGILLITHRLFELYEVCEDVTVLRNGEHVFSGEMKDVTEQQLITHMLGRTLDAQFPDKREEKLGKVVLTLDNLSDALGSVRDVSLALHKGQIYGIGGLVGAGKTELCELLFGITPIKSGRLWVGNEEIIHHSTHSAVENGMALIPEERRRSGLFIEESVLDNSTIVSLKKDAGRFGFLRKKSQQQRTAKVIEQLSVVTPNDEIAMKKLSGGNQQKIVIGKWLLSDAEIYIFDEPTKGVDVGAKKDIFELIQGLRSAGKAVLYVSSEWQELIGLADCISIMWDGRLSEPLATDKWNESNFMTLATGGELHE
ncbi:MAG: sugar ABC transporter ATP-binding protein [Bacilli bacterium]